MKSCQVGDMYRSVRACMDEIGFNDADFVGMDKDSSELDLIIHNKILEAIRYIHLIAPIKYLDGISLPDILFKKNDLIGEVNLPNDFLRILSVKIKSWIRPVSEVIYEDNVEYHKQSDVYARGTYESPVVAIVKRETTDAMEFYSLKSADDTLDKFLYVPIPKFTKEGEVESVSFCSQCENAIISYIAGLTKQVLRDETASIHFENTKAYLQ